MSLSAEQKKYIKGNYRKLSVKKLAKTLQADPADVLHYISDFQKNLQTSRHRIYWILLVIFPVIVFVLLESGLRIFNYGGNRQLFVSVAATFIDSD
jgi:hypothetical protein